MPVHLAYRFIKNFWFRTPHRNAKRAVAGLVLAVITITALGFQFGRKDPGQGDGPVINSGLTFHTCALAGVADELEILGQIIYYEKVAVSSKVTGRLEKIYVRAVSYTHLTLPTKRIV